MTATEAEVEAAMNAHTEHANQFRPYDPKAAFSAALAAVEPLIRERLAQEVEALPAADGESFFSVDARDGYDDAITDAARIVRGDAS